MDIDISRIALIVLNFCSPDLTIKNTELALSNNKGVIAVIVDNNSPDDSYELISRHFEFSSNVYVIRNPENNGYSAGNNFGIKFILEKHSNIEYIIIMNPDVRCEEKHLFVKMGQELAEDESLAVIAPLMIQDEHLVVSKLGWKCDEISDVILKRLWIANSKLKAKNMYRLFELNTKHDILYCEVVQGSLFMIKRNVFEEVGLFDENTFMYYEENILGFKLKKLGYTEGTMLSSIYYHDHSLKERDLDKMKLDLKRQFKSARYYSKKYLKANFLIIAILDLLGFIHINIELPFRKLLKNR
ncbi:MAG: glycosyltransferase family 2 protein [Bacteroides thetaiotaomicron]|nr:glycosyltransferase family 2 protein [Bacteroides thetaiotaomicron]